MLTRAIFGLTALSATAACIALASPSVPKETPAPVLAPVVSTEGAPAPAAMKFPQCLRGFSKDGCDGVMYPGEEYTDGCGHEECKTLFMRAATLVLNLKRNERECSPEGKCDECPEKDGTLKVGLDYLVRLNKPCPYRGCMDGKGELRCRDGSVFTGEFHGTIGVGTHRKFECLEYRNCYCENCVDVEQVDHGTWRLGWEATFHGERSDVFTGEMVCFSLSGDFYLSGDGNGVYTFSNAFKVKNTADGVFGTFCQ